MKSLKIRFIELFIGEVDESLKKGFWLIAELIKKYKYFLFVLLIFGIIIGLIEGAAIGLIAYSAVVVTGSLEQCPAFAEKVLSFTPLTLCEQYDKYKIFLYLIYASLIVQIIKSIIVYVSGYLGIVLKTRVAYNVRSRVIEKMVQLDFQQSSSIPTGEKQLISANSLNISNLVIVVNQVIVTCCVLLVYMAILVSMDWKLSIWAGVLILFLLFIVSPLLNKVRKISLEVRLNSRVMQRKIIDYMFSLRLVKLFGKEKEVFADIDEIIRKEVGFIRSSSAYSLALDPLQETIVILSVGAMLLFSFFSAGNSIEQFLPATLAYVLVLHKCNSRVAVLNTIRTSFVKAMAGVQYVSDFLNLEARHITTGTELIDNDWKEIMFSNVSFQYQNSDVLVLNDLNFSIQRGETVAFVGGSGAGKTTLVDVLVGLLQPSSGMVAIDEVDSIKASKETWLSQFSMVSQTDLMLNASIKDNLKFSNINASEEEVMVAAEIAQVGSFIEDQEKGIDTNLGEMGGNFSGGQIQRIAFARAILKDAPVLVLDEATSALDVITEKKIIDSLKRDKQNKTIIMIAHRLSTVMNADRIFVLDSGHIIESGSHEDLIQKGGKYSLMWQVNQ